MPVGWMPEKMTRGLGIVDKGRPRSEHRRRSVQAGRRPDLVMIRPLPVLRPRRRVGMDGRFARLVDVELPPTRLDSGE